MERKKMPVLYVLSRTQAREGSGRGEAGPARE